MTPSKTPTRDARRALPLGVAGDSDMSDPSELPVVVVKSDFPFK